MESTTTLTHATLEPAQSWAQSEARKWQVRAPYLTMWLSQASAMLEPSDVGDVVLCYDPDVRLVSIDVYRDGSRVFGMDDLV